jgi:hypothetical protein
MKSQLNRRQMLAGTGAAMAWAVLGTARRASAAPQATIVDTKVISLQPNLYHGWPTLARRKDGQLLVVCSGGREDHVCPFGRVELIRSNDGGQTWGWPCVVMDCEIDDRDAGVLETSKGTLLITSFTSLAYEPRLKKAEEAGDWPADRLERWQTAHNRLTAEQRQSLMGSWMIRSTDGGLTWSGRYDSVVNSPHGPIQLSDGRLLYPGVSLWKGNRVGAAESTDDGQTWHWLSEIPARNGDDPKDYHELHGVETADGRIVVQIRNHNKANAGETLQTESSDGGRTWAEPKAIGVWGVPSHLLRLNDGRLLMTYGHRREPLGNQARVSSDHGRTWSEPVIVSGDGARKDLGYPSSAQLDDGSLVTVWYEHLKDSPCAVLRQAKWTLGG